MCSEDSYHLCLMNLEFLFLSQNNSKIKLCVLGGNKLYSKKIENISLKINPNAHMYSDVS